MEKHKGKLTVDVSSIIDRIDAYPAKAGIDPDLWVGMTYAQKCLYLAKKGLEAVESMAKESEETDE